MVSNLIKVRIAMIIVEDRLGNDCEDLCKKEKITQTNLVPYGFWISSSAICNVDNSKNQLNATSGKLMTLICPCLPYKSAIKC